MAASHWPRTDKRDGYRGWQVANTMLGAEVDPSQLQFTFQVWSFKWQSLTISSYRTVSR